VLLKPSFSRYENIELSCIESPLPCPESPYVKTTKKCLCNGTKYDNKLKSVTCRKMQYCNAKIKNIKQPDLCSVDMLDRPQCEYTNGFIKNDDLCVCGNSRSSLCGSFATPGYYCKSDRAMCTIIPYCRNNNGLRKVIDSPCACGNTGPLRDDTLSPSDPPGYIGGSFRITSSKDVICRIGQYCIGGGTIKWMKNKFSWHKRDEREQNSCHDQPVTCQHWNSTGCSYKDLGCKYFDTNSPMTVNSGIAGLTGFSITLRKALSMENDGDGGELIQLIKSPVFEAELNDALVNETMFQAFTEILGKGSIPLMIATADPSGKSPLYDSYLPDDQNEPDKFVTVLDTMFQLARVIVERSKTPEAFVRDDSDIHVKGMNVVGGSYSRVLDCSHRGIIGHVYINDIPKDTQSLFLNGNSISSFAVNGVKNIKTLGLFEHDYINSQNKNIVGAEFPLQYYQFIMRPLLKANDAVKINRHFVNNTLSRFYQICPKGTYNDDPSSLKCKICPSGRYNSDDSSLSKHDELNDCIKCQKGKYLEYREPDSPSYHNGVHRCLDCDKGKFQINYGTSFCDICTIGF
jgi:hypothetical protein